MADIRVGQDNARPAAGRAFDWDLAFLTGWAGPLMVVARVMFATIFIFDGAEPIVVRRGRRLYAGERRRSADPAPCHSDRDRRRPFGALRPQDALGDDRALRILSSDRARHSSARG